MNKGREAFIKLSEMGYLNIPMPKPNVEWTDEDDEALGYAYDVDKGLKALDIISEKLDLYVSHHSNSDTYMIVIPNDGEGTYIGIDISKEEYDLLNEVLNNGR